MLFTYRVNTIGPLLIVQQLLKNKLIGEGSIVGNVTSKVRGFHNPWFQCCQHECCYKNGAVTGCQACKLGFSLGQSSLVHASTFYCHSKAGFACACHCCSLGQSQEAAVQARGCHISSGRPSPAYHHQAGIHSLTQEDIMDRRVAANHFDGKFCMSSLDTILTVPWSIRQTIMRG